jgi:hypothetical protein
VFQIKKLIINNSPLFLLQKRSFFCGIMAGSTKKFDIKNVVRFDPEFPIQLADGREVPAKDVKIGDRVKTRSDSDEVRFVTTAKTNTWVWYAHLNGSRYRIAGRVRKSGFSSSRDWEVQGSTQSEEAELVGFVLKIYHIVSVDSQRTEVACFGFSPKERLPRMLLPKKAAKVAKEVKAAKTAKVAKGSKTAKVEKSAKVSKAGKKESKEEPEKPQEPETKEESKDSKESKDEASDAQNDGSSDDIADLDGSDLQEGKPETEVPKKKPAAKTTAPKVQKSSAKQAAKQSGKRASQSTEEPQEHEEREKPPKLEPQAKKQKQ